MARYRNELDDERDYYRREERQRRDSLGAFDQPYSARDRYEQDSRQGYNRGGRFGERAQYEYDEPRYSEQRDIFAMKAGAARCTTRGDLQPNAGGTATIEVLSGRRNVRDYAAATS